MQNSYLTCSICCKKHWGKSCYKESGAYFGCGKHGHMIQDCPKNKKFMIRKLKEENKENKQKPRVQGRMFAMTHQDALKPLLMWRHVLFKFSIGKVVFVVAYLKVLWISNWEKLEYEI